MSDYVDPAVEAVLDLTCPNPKHRDQYRNLAEKIVAAVANCRSRSDIRDADDLDLMLNKVKGNTEMLKGFTDAADAET